MKVLFSGGGTLGPVTPLLAIHDVIHSQYSDAAFVWIGTANGPEKELIEKKGIRFTSIASGKLRRYLSIWNIIDILRLIVGFFESFGILMREKPDACISAGGFVSVPVHLAAWVLGIPSWVHQQDVVVGMANRMMAPFARVITTALQESVSRFQKEKTTWLGNPVRQDIFGGDKERARVLFHLDPALPVVFVIGGGTGSLRVNQLVVEALEQLMPYSQVIHLSGKERPQDMVREAEKHAEHYHVYQFFTDEMKDAFAVADIVVARGGFGSISEIAAASKPTIFIPKPGHQEENVSYLTTRAAALSVNEGVSNGHALADMIIHLLNNAGQQKALGEKLHAVVPEAKRENMVVIFDNLIKR